MKIVVWIFVLFHLAIVYSLLLRYEDYICPFGIFKLLLIKSPDLDIALLPIPLPNICKLSGIELKDISIQQELIFIEKDRICINMKYLFTIYRTFFSYIKQVANKCALWTLQLCHQYELQLSGKSMYCTICVSIIYFDLYK